MAITRRQLSGSSNGRPVTVTTGAPATIHTSTTLGSDEIHVWYCNAGASATTISIYLGSTGTGDQIQYELPTNDGLYLISPGLFLASGLVCYGSAGATGVLAYGFVNRLTTGA